MITEIPELDMVKTIENELIYGNILHGFNLDVINQLFFLFNHFHVGLFQQVKKISEEKYPETELLRAIKGVGPITALAFVLILEDPERFSKSRQVGSFIGLTPSRDQSGEIDKQLRITKAGNPLLRRLLVGAAQYILGPFGEACDLRRFGLKLSARGGKNAKRRAVVAVARKLTVLLYRLWRHGEIYGPLYTAKRKNLAKDA